MAGNEWVIKVTADVKDVLDASRQIGQAGKQAGQEFQQGFNGNDKTLSGLSSQLKETTGGVKDFAESQKTIAKGQVIVDTALDRGTGVLGGLTEGVKNFALQTASVLTVGAALQFAGKQIMDLDTASAAVRTLGVDSDKLSKELLKLSVELDSNVSRVELMQASYDVASSGFTKTAEIVDILRASALGATGGFSDLGTVADAVTSVINSYGLKAADATSIVDSFVQTQNDGKITVKQFGDNIGNIAAVAAAAGIPLSELSAAIADATAKGVPVEQTFTGLRQAISSIIKPTDQATAEAAKLGISYNLTGLKARGFAGFLEDVVAKSKGSADSIAILTGSVEAQAPIQQIANDKLANYNKFLDNQINKNGQAKEASEIASSTIVGGIEKVTNAASNLVTVLGRSQALSAVGESLGILAKGIEMSAALIDQALPLIMKAIGLLAGAETPIGKLLTSATNKYKELVITGVNWITSTLLGTQFLTAAQEKQNDKKKELSKIEQDILDAANQKTKADLTQLDNAEKLLNASSKLAKAQSDSQIQIGQANINLGNAIVKLEESRFDIVINRNKAELDAAKQRGASESELNVIKRRGEELELAALNAKYQGLVKQQGLERALLALKQQQAITEADLDIQKAEAEITKTKLQLTKAINNQNKEAEDDARATLAVKQLDLQTAQTKRATLGQIQPIERQIAAYTDEIAVNGLKATAEGKRFKQAADGTFTAVKSTALEFQSYGNSLKVPLSQQTEFARLAKSMGFDVRKNKDGFYEIGKALKETNVPPSDRVKKAMATTANALKGASGQARNLTDNTNNAADAAERFRDALVTAAGLPPARFTGGPVDAGQTYRVNDGPGGLSLGQEAFLSSSGVLSLINRPMNSLWTAPSRGTVIPAAVTSRLKDRGLLGGAGVLRSGTDPAVAHLTMAVGNLSQEVAELRRKAWNVSVGVRGDGSGLRLAQTMARMR